MLNVHVGATREKAMAAVRNAHDEFCRFLAPYGRFRNYLLPDGTNRPFGFQPELEDSMEQRIAAVGTPDDVAQVIGDFKDLLDLKHLVVFLEFPGPHARPARRAAPPRRRRGHAARRADRMRP